MQIQRNKLSKKKKKIRKITKEIDIRLRKQKWWWSDQWEKLIRKRKECKANQKRCQMAVHVTAFNPTVPHPRHKTMMLTIRPQHVQIHIQQRTKGNKGSNIFFIDCWLINLFLFFHFSFFFSRLIPAIMKLKILLRLEKEAKYIIIATDNFKKHIARIGSEAPLWMKTFLL